MYADHKIELAVQAHIEEGKSQTESYLRAYPEQREKCLRKTLHEAASRMFRDDKVSAILERVKAEHRERHVKTTDDIVERLQEMAFADITDIYDDTGTLLPPKSWPKGVKALLAGIDVVSLGSDQEALGQVMKVKLESRLKSIEMLGKQIGMWPNKTEVTGAGGGPIQTEEVVSDAELARRVAFMLTKGTTSAG